MKKSQRQQESYSLFLDRMDNLLFPKARHLVIITSDFQPLSKVICCCLGDCERSACKLLEHVIIEQCPLLLLISDNYHRENDGPCTKFSIVLFIRICFYNVLIKREVLISRLLFFQDVETTLTLDISASL